MINLKMKALFGDIKILCNKSGYCWANNAYFAERYGVTPKTIQVWIRTLKDHGYITTEVVNNNARYIVTNNIKDNDND